MTPRQRQIERALGTRARQLERHMKIERIVGLDDHWPNTSGRSRARTHHGYAINVKDPRGAVYEPEIGDGPAAFRGYRAYERARDAFWHLATELGHDHNFTEVCGEGRSGGWCVPYPQPPEDDMYDHELDDWLWTQFGPWALNVLALIPDLREQLEAGEFDDENLEQREPTVPLVLVDEHDAPSPYAAVPDVPAHP